MSDDISFTKTINSNSTVMTLKRISDEIEQKRSHSIDMKELYLLEDKDNLAYIMFTSGSTGEPKGVAIIRRNLCHFIEWIRCQFPTSTGSVHTNVNPLYFDNSVFDLFSTFTLGATLSFYDLDDKEGFERLAININGSKIDQLFCVPSLLIRLIDYNRINTVSSACKTSCRFIFGGEGYPSPLLKQLIRSYPKGAFFNVYGPTECTRICSCHQIKSVNFDEYKKLPTLGKLIKPFNHVILNKDSNGLGELVLSGPMVGEGYFRRSELTENVFGNYINDREISYKTGDIVKEENGLLFHCGRVDNQIKRFGFRIELEEIEYMLRSISFVYDAGVLYT